MHDATRVTVYNFRLVKLGHESVRSSHFKATREAIRRTFGDDPIEATAEEVDAAEVDADGTFRRLQSQWGTLD